MSVDRNSDITKGSNAIWTKNNEHENKDDELDDTDPEVIRRLHIIANKEDFNTYKIYVKNIVTNGASYFGRLNVVTIKGQTKDGMKELNLFVKSAMYGDGLANVLDVTILYSNEIYFYNELSKVFAKLQDKANIPLKERYNIVHSYEESDKDHMIMENMTCKGFEIKSRYDLASLEFAKKSIEELAKFHALSFVLERKEPEYFNNNLKNKKYPVNFDGEWKRFLKNLIDTIRTYLDDHSLEKYEVFISSIADKAAATYGPHSIMCLCHGDYRNANILHRKNVSFLNFHVYLYFYVNLVFL